MEGDTGSPSENPQRRTSEPLLAWRPAAAQPLRRRRGQTWKRLSLHRQWSRSGRKWKGSLEATRRLPRQPRNPLLEQGQDWFALITYARYQLCAPQQVHSKAKKKVRIKAGRTQCPRQARATGTLGEGRAGRAGPRGAENARGIGSSGPSPLTRSPPRRPSRPAASIGRLAFPRR